MTNALTFGKNPSNVSSNPITQTEKRNAELMLRVCSLSSWCNSHACLGSTCYILPQGRRPLLPWEGNKAILPRSSSTVPVWPCPLWWLAEVSRVYLPNSCVTKIGKLLCGEPMTLHLLSSIRLLSSASAFDSSHEAVTYFHVLEHREI